MELGGDPFPTSLPPFEEPQIFDANMTEATYGNALDYDENMLYDTPNYFSASYQSPGKSQGNHPVMTTTGFDLSSTQSPESLPDSSSSDSSHNQHKRNHSSDSSRSGALGGDGDTRMTGGTPAPNGILVAASPVGDRLSSEPSASTDINESNKFMAASFDFDSATSSPSPYSDTKAAFYTSSIRPQDMPFPSGPVVGLAHRIRPHSGRSKSSREIPPLLSMMENQGAWLPTAGHALQSSIHSGRDYVNGTMISGTPQGPDWPYEIAPGDHNAFEPGAANTFHPTTMAIPFISPSPILRPKYRPILQVRPLPPKSRVETQIPVTLILHPVPLGITRLHLQTYTISKSKLVAKPAPEKSSDMLELHAMLVCTSAMQDLAKRGRAFARAAGSQSTILSNECPSSSEDTPPEEDENKPLNGGPVHICTGCIQRERKRAARKKTKNHEEEELWLDDNAKRAIIFNTQEVKEWQPPSLPKSKESMQSNGAYVDLEFPENALQVDIPMRITCYCRHQEEKIGYQVIFTLRDYQDNVVAQTTTNSIVITDDHKSHGTPGVMPVQNPVISDTMLVPGAGVFPQAPITNHGPAPYRNSYSTTDLQGMQQQYHAHQMSPFSIPQNTSQSTSATLTPKNLSRQTSPSALSGQQHKRRKASSSGRMRNDLTMTKLQPPSVSNIPFNGVSSAVQSFGGLPASETNYAPSHGIPMSSMPLQYSTNPPTPTTTDSTFFSSAQRSQSMENLQGFPRIFSAPSSVRQSRVPSPTSGPQSNGIPQTHAQMLSNSLHSVPGAAHPQRLPVIHKLTPAEGPKSGGIEVTCLGSGFRQGLEVMFGTTQATTTTYWGENALVCLVPPAVKSGTVLVTFKPNHEQRSVSPPNKLAVFNYIDDDEQELMKQALNLINQQFNGSTTDAGGSARNIINRILGTNGSFMGDSSQGSNQQRHVSGNSNIAIAGIEDLETAILNCVNLVDLDDSPYQASLNAQGNNGQSMLHLSASLGFYRLTAGLLARGANPDIRDNNGMSPMHMASLRGHQQIIRKLRSAGADPTMRSLNGFTPADMAAPEQAHDASNAFDHHTLSKSAGATPTSHLSRASSILSFKSFRESHTRVTSTGLRSGKFEGEESGDEGLVEAYWSQPVTPAQMYARSRRNSLTAEQNYPSNESEGDLAQNASLFAANPAMSAWKDQLSAQFQQLQQSVHRTLPNLQVPGLPPIPNLPDYQAYPVVRRISSLVPQRNSRPSTMDGSPGTAKEADYHWWELLTGPSSLPPAYEEIYPENTRKNTNDRKISLLRAACEVFVDRKCEETFEQAGNSSLTDTVDPVRSGVTKRLREQSRVTHAMKVKKLRSDRNLFFIWIPLLVLVIVAMLMDRAPTVLHGAFGAFHYAQDRFQGRVVEAV